jgi:hypothetical protein
MNPRPHTDQNAEQTERKREMTHSLLRPVAGFVAIWLIVIAFSAGQAQADDYSGMLAAGTTSLSSNASSEPGGWTYGDDSWTAPGSTNFNGFAYTGAAFSVVSDNGVGGVSIGFGGDGSANQPTILFPWTQDCSITNIDHYWTRDSRIAGTSSEQTCSTSGNTSGWNYANAESENTAPAVNPEVEYHTLWFTAFCQAGECNYDPSNEEGWASASVNNLSANVDDPNNQPSGGASWTINNGSSWYQTDSSAPSINVSASDPAGVCAIGAQLTGPGSYYLQLMNASPSMENPGGPIGTEFDSITPCPGAGSGAVGGSGSLGPNMASGTYSLAIVASNPGNWEAGTGLENAPTIASYGNTINVDDTVPSVNWLNTSGGWTSATSEQFTVSAGPSGISSVACTDNGTPVAPAKTSGNTYSVATPNQGANSMSCTASNGDSNGVLSSAAAALTYNVDTTTPTVNFSDGGYTQSTWASSAQTMTVRATGGPSGINALKCYADSTSVALGGAGGDQITVSGDGKHVLSCTAISNTNVEGTATFDVWIDTRQPDISFSGAAPAPVWLTGTPTVIVIGGEPGGTLSGITKLTCTVNGGTPITLNVDAAQNNTTSFALTPNGADVISCEATNAAGTTGSAYTETVNLDNPTVQAQSSSLTKYGSSPNIDGSDDPYSNGPSPTTWSHTPQTVTLTAVNSSGGAAIAQIDCTGASQTGNGTYPANSQNAYDNVGERITVTVEPPGGDLTCTAIDTAGNSYPLGSYEFEIDNQAPTGYFIPENEWASPDEAQLHLSDGTQGSGTAAVEVTAQNNSGRIFKVMATRNGSDSDIWDARFNDSEIPPGLYTFIAYPTDVANNSTSITTNQAGTTETLPLPFREMTSISDELAAGSNTATGSQQAAVTIPVANAGTKHSLLSARAADAAGCLQETANAPCGSSAGVSPKRLKYLTLGYAHKATLSGVLRNSRSHKPVAHARIVIQQQVAGSDSTTVLARVRTNHAGAYTYRVAPGADRTLIAVYNGTKQLRGAQADVGEHVRGTATIRVTGTLAPGHSVDVAGNLKGGYVPARGALITVQYAVKGFRGWTNWGDARTTPRGAFNIHMPVLPADAGYSFEWRARIPSQTGWGYLAGDSNTVTRHIPGRIRRSGNS